jgi:hypothetical protein
MIVHYPSIPEHLYLRQWVVLSSVVYLPWFTPDLESCFHFGAGAPLQHTLLPARMLTYLPHLQLFHLLRRSIESYSTVAKSTTINRTTHFRRALDQEKGMPLEIT